MSDETKDGVLVLLEQNMRYRIAMARAFTLLAQLRGEVLKAGVPTKCGAEVDDLLAEGWPPK